MENKGISKVELSSLPTDFLNIENDEEVIKQIDENESLIFSAEIIRKGIVKHQMIVMLTNLKVYVLGRNQRRVKLQHHISTLYAITLSLIQENPKFIMHIKNLPDIEYSCIKRDVLLDLLKVQYFEITKRNLPVYGVSSKSLKDYTTTDKDLMRGISRVPTIKFRMWEHDIKQTDPSLRQTDTLNNFEIDPKEFRAMAFREDEEEEEEVKVGGRKSDGLMVFSAEQGNKESPKQHIAAPDDFLDDFVILARPKLDKYNRREKLNKEEEQMDSSHSQCLISKEGLPKSKLNDFKVIKVIDKGSFGKVFLVVNKFSGQLYAMKRINKNILINKKQIQNTKNEKDILFLADHPFILTMEYVFQNDYRIYFFMKYVRGGTLFDNLCEERRFTETSVRFFISQIVLAFGYLHDKNIMHRDLKPENVLLDEEGYACLADFGLARYVENTGNDQSSSFCGTPEYLAPEILERKGHGMVVDWWTLGVLTYEISVGTPPFVNENRFQLGQMIKTKDPVFPTDQQKKKYNIQMSKVQKDFILRLMDKNPETRLGANGDWKEVSQHPYFQGIDFDKLKIKEYKSPYIPKQSVLTLHQSDIQTLMRLNSVNVQDGKLVVKKKKGALEALGGMVGKQNSHKNDDDDIYKVLDTDVFANPAFHGIITEELRDDDLPADQKLFIQQHLSKFKDF